MTCSLALALADGATMAELTNTGFSKQCQLIQGPCKFDYDHSSLLLLSTFDNASAVKDEHQMRSMCQ